ncbi:hypothetical protein Bca52824_024223 [Brassica carinata]|uniref:Glycerophosphodiester phosphodiesterase n=1 Tax=Brassica carinata TaxID=52824 RepID=A0A8X7VK17_BRACI|nr:hypothetical protein Bca52824_024223 [Brassica carinata]
MADTQWLDFSYFLSLCDAPLVIARGGFSGLFPDSSIDAYKYAMQTSVAGAVLWCDVQLTKNGHGICFPDLKLNNASDIEYAYPNRQKSYPVNGVTTQGWFTIDFALRDLKNVSLFRGILSRSEKFDGIYAILTVQDVTTQIKPESFWLNVQHDAFYAQHSLSMSSFLISASRTVSIDYISSPEVNFFRKIAGRLGRKGPSLVFQFLGKEDFEPTTKRTYGSILSNLTYVKTFASGILVPKSYIFPLDYKMYLLPPTSLVQDAHKAGLQVYVSGFSNDDADIAYNYSSDPVSEYLTFVDNGDFSVDGVLSDFPVTASASIDCFSHVSRHATKQVDFLVISKNGANGDYPGCTDLAYEKAIEDGADVIDCSFQMSSDGKPFCSSSIDLEKSTMVIQSPFRNRSTIIPEISSDPGIYTFSLTWPEIQSLTPAIMNPYRVYNMFRNPNDKNSGKIISLSEFLNLANNSTSLYGVLISVEDAVYLREKQGLDVVKAVLDTLTETGYSNGTTTTKVMIQSTHSSVLVDFKKQSKYETVYKVEEEIRDISDSAIEDIKKFANAVIITKSSVFPDFESFVSGQTDVVERLRKSKLPVYVELFQNEFVSQPYDFLSDATVEINSYITGAGINGTITEFPFTAARYKRNLCLGRKEIPPYMSPIQPGYLLSLVNFTSLSPAQAPSPAFTDDDVTEAPLPPLYDRCSTRFICGDQGGLLYPFWIPGREECGHPDFKLTCARGFAEISIASVKFRILEANYTTRIIRLARSDYIGHLCPQDPTNATFNENILQFSPNTDLLTIYHDCRDFSFSTPVYDPTYFRELGCDDVFGGSYYVTRNLSSPLLDGVRDLLNILRVLCLTIVSIPASGPALSTLQRFQTSDNLKKALEEGFELGVNRECSMCMDSGGGCGYNQTTRGFICYCSNGPHSRACSSGKKNHGSSAGALVLLVILILILRKRILLHHNRKQNLKTLIPLKHYSYAQVKRITNSFAEVVGKGGFGTVYRGTLSDGSMVAVKVLKDSKCDGEDFVNEVVSMSRTSHVNIVSLLGFCSEGSKRAIVYELLENGSLDRFISTNNSVSMDWMAMHGIALGVARGLEYLHYGCKTRIVHFDIKPQNVLLDDDLCPKVSDFGLAKLCKKKESTMSLLDMRGTIGYIAPEMISRVYGSVSHKSDVYSYGMLVLEMIAARNKTSAENYASDTSSMYFPEWIYKDLEKGDDERLVGNGISKEGEEIAKKMTLVGLWCIQSSPSDRPPMNRVVEMMEGSLDSLEVPPKPVWQIPTVPLPETSWISEETADLYHRCSTRFICGDQVGLLYPFWIPGREECGHPDFKLTCDRGFSEINIASVKFRILEANYTTRIIRLARSDYIGHLCPQDPTNAPFNENILQFSPNTDLLTLYYDCRDFSFSTPAYDPTYFRELGCDDELGRSYYVTRNLVLCLTIVSIPASGPALSTLQRFQTSDNLKKALEEGFELGVNQECSMCMESGGGCGYNQTTRGFVCYCNNGPHSRTCSSKASCVLVAGVLVLLVILIPILRKRKASHDNRKQNLKTLIPLKHYSYAQVKRITNSFAEVVGEGGFGAVYRGSLSDGSMVLVKVLKDSKCNGEDFVNEVVSMSRTSHVNIVSLLGFCSKVQREQLFISTNNSMSIDWMAMHGIARSVARGLEYLHHGCKTRIVHFDIKPQNVLLDDDLCPKVSDFGLAKLCKKKESTMSLLDLRGTIGYIAPEMISRVYGSVSHKSDVYSYGISMYFPEWIYKDLEKGDDERLVGNGISNEEEEIAKKMTLVGLWCIQSSPSDRPPMNRVVEMMEGNLDSLEVPPKPVWQIPTVPLPETSWISEEKEEECQKQIKNRCLPRFMVLLQRGITIGSLLIADFDG